MLNNTTTTKLHEMKLSAMATAFRHQSETDGFSELSFEERFGLLVDAEWTSRRNNRLTRLLKKAGFSEPGACLEDIAYSVCILPPARKNPATLPVKICHVTGFPCQ